MVPSSILFLNGFIIVQGGRGFDCIIIVQGGRGATMGDCFKAGEHQLCLPRVSLTYFSSHCYLDSSNKKFDMTMLYGCWLCYYECGDKNEFQDYQKFDLPSFTSSTKVRAMIFCVYIKLIDFAIPTHWSNITNKLISLSPPLQGDHRGAHQGHPQGVSQHDDDDGEK